VSLDVAAGELVAILGPNGAGKTTLLRAIMGLVAARGDVVFDGRRVTDLPTARRAGLGIAMVPEGRGVLGPLTVRENLDLGAYTRRGRVPRTEIEADLARVHALFPRLRERSAQRAGSLSGGEQQMLAVGRALMSRPRLLLLDEPSLGLAPRVVREIFVALGELNREGLAIVLVEQKARLALAMARRAFVLRGGQVAARVTPSEASSVAELAGLYLGPREPA
jgi:branched-chain amino acid transport system ATP-binding protein